MKNFIFNNENLTSAMGEYNVIYTPNMKKVFLLKDVESVICSCFHKAKTIDEAVILIKKHFSGDSFNENECRIFIEKLILEGILTNA